MLDSSCRGLQSLLMEANFELVNKLSIKDIVVTLEGYNAIKEFANSNKHGCLFVTP